MPSQSLLIHSHILLGNEKPQFTSAYQRDYIDTRAVSGGTAVVTAAAGSATAGMGVAPVFVLGDAQHDWSTTNDAFVAHPVPKRWGEAERRAEPQLDKHNRTCVELGSSLFVYDGEETDYRREMKSHGRSSLDQALARMATQSSATRRPPPPTSNCVSWEGTHSSHTTTYGAACEAVASAEKAATAPNPRMLRSAAAADFGGPKGGSTAYEIARRVHVRLGNPDHTREYTTANGEAMALHPASSYGADRVKAFDPFAQLQKQLLKQQAAVDDRSSRGTAVPTSTSVDIGAAGDSGQLWVPQLSVGGAEGAAQRPQRALSSVCFGHEPTIYTTNARTQMNSCQFVVVPVV